MKTKYDRCHERTMDKYMKKFEKGELKDRSEKKIRSRKQAVAIALSISDNKCENKFSKEDFKKIEEKFNKNIFENKGISNKKLSYTTVKNGLKLVDYYKSNGKKAKSNNILNKLLLKVFMEIRKGNINKLIIDDIIEYLE